MRSFEKTNLRNDIKETIIKEFGFTEQTLIQEKSIPLILQGKDILGESATGSGKTLAFGVGIIHNVAHGKGLQGLVITPTRELADQVRKDITKLDKRLKMVSIYGGVSINPQIDELRTADVVVATPGRLKDHMQRKTVDLSKIKVLVLDEADRMLDMGFIEDIEFIIRGCARQRQTLFFSATLPPAIKKLADNYMKNPVRVTATKHVDPSKLKQAYYDIKPHLKFSLLLHLIEHEESDLIMVFCNTRRNVDMVVRNLRANKIDAVALHGGYTQNKRNKAIDVFKKGHKQVLVCTDVAARGMHVEGISHIYNYDIPSDPTDYVHRIGRTARAGEKGKVVNLLSEYDHDNFRRVMDDYRSFEVRKMKRPYIKKAFFKK